MSNQRKHDFFMAKLKREEAEKQEQAAKRLAKQKHEIAMRKNELEIQMEQMALQELEEDHRQRVAAAKLDNAELLDNRSLFNHHSSKINLFNNKGSDRLQKFDWNWVNLFPTCNSLNAASELNFSRPGSATADHPVQDTAIKNTPQNASSGAGNLNHLESLSQNTRPWIAHSVAQQEGLYREYLQAKLRQPLSDQKTEQAHSPSGSGGVKAVNRASTDLQNVALPPLQLPMQPPRPPTLVMPSSNSNTFLLNFSANPRGNQTMDQQVLHLRPKSSSMPCQLHLHNPPFAQQQNLPQNNIPQETQPPLPIPCIISLHLRTQS